MGWVFATKESEDLAKKALEQERQARAEATKNEVKQIGGGNNPWKMKEWKPIQLGADAFQKIDLQGQSFDPYRQRALADIDAQTSAGLAGAQTQLAQTGGLSAADRAALASQFNRDKIMGRGSVLGRAAEMQAQSQAAADKATQMFNAEQARQLAIENFRAQQMGQQAQRDDEMLQKQLQAAAIISAQQADMAGTGGIWENLFG